jgi:broad specificity phosphatase PhoE
MSTLYLFRHAQASFLEENYDQLSTLGERQAHVLAQFLVRNEIRFDLVAAGPCVRQRHTAQIVADAYAAAGVEFPAPVTFSEFDEYQAEEVVKALWPNLLGADPAVAELHRVFAASPDQLAQRRSFQNLFAAIIGKWVREEVVVPGIESWQQFTARVNSGLTKFLALGRHGEQAAIFTSGGPIAVAVQRALALSTEHTLGLSWMSRNSSYSEFLYDAERFTLSSFNSHPHIVDFAMRTYR